MVDARFPGVSPASRIRGMRSPNCSRRSTALAQAGCPEIFPLVPVIGPLTRLMSAFDNGGFRPAQRHIPRVSGHLQWNARRRFDQQGQGAGPELRGKFVKRVRNVPRKRDRLRNCVDQNRQRARFRASFDAVNLLDGRQIEWVRGNTIKSIGRNGHEFAAAYKFGCVSNHCGIRIFRRNFQQLSRQVVVLLVKPKFGKHQTGAECRRVKLP